MKRHKKVFITILAVVIIIMSSIIYVLYNHNIIPHKSYQNEAFNIITYQRQVDKDGDGIDDQTNLLGGVRGYIATNPNYKSKYYGSGYPDDEYGVCSDVVAFGLLDAKKIDFRRVKNLNVYFNNNAICLTTDVYKIDQW